MREATKHKLQAAIAASGVQYASVPEAPAFGASISDYLWTLIGGLAATAAMYSFDAKDVSRVVPLSRNELDALREPTARVLDKYAGKLGRYQDETALVLTVVAIGQQKYTELSRMAANRKAIEDKHVEQSIDRK